MEKVELKPEIRELSGDEKIIAMLESNGYKDVRRRDQKNFNDLFLATKDGVDCFIKKYNTHHGKDETNLKRAKNEMICYQNLPQDLLIDMVEANISERYLALRYMEMEDFQEDEEMLEKFMNLGLEEFSKINTSFLGDVSHEAYDELYEKIRNLFREGLIANADEVIEIFKNNHDEIENAPKVFSHGDLNRLNVKKHQGKTKVFDFEISSPNNAMVDMAVIYIDIFNNPQLKDYFWQRINKSQYFNKRLLYLMIIQRSVRVMNVYLKRNQKEKSKFYLANEKAFFESLAGLLEN
jgi:thiamine kinase-like enzyme